MNAKKIIVILILCISMIISVTACSNDNPKITLSSNDGTRWTYDGKTYVLHPGLKVLNHGKKIGESREIGAKADIYEIQGMEADSWLGLRYKELSVIFVLKESNVPWITLKEFSPKEIQSTFSTVKIKDEKLINQLVDIIEKNEQVAVNLQNKMPVEYHLFSDKYPNLVYVISYFEMDNGKKYIIDYSNNHTTGAIYDISNLTLPK